MNKTLLLVITVLCIILSSVMFLIGSTNSALTELLDFFYYPIPIAIIAFLGLIKKKK